MNQVVIDIVTSPADILKSLLESKISGTMVGISSPDLGPGTYITAVKDILISDEDDPIIVIKGYDMSGYFLDKGSLRLKNITSVIPFTSLFENPFTREIKRELKELQTDRDNTNIKESDFIR